MGTAVHLVTGSTGLLGSHVVERLVADGKTVRALVRPGSDTSFLDALGVPCVPGNLEDPTTLPAVLNGVDVVFHCAARVGDWGPWKLFQRAVIDATGHLLDACRSAGVRRFLHVSSINVYGHPHLARGQVLTEDDPIGQRLWWWDHYCRAKIAAEGLVRAHPGEWTIVRPSWIYGPRDRNSFPRVVRAIEEGRAVMVGTGENRLNLVHATDVAEGVVCAVSQPDTAGRTYNLASEGVISQHDLLGALTDLLGRPRIRRRIPYGLALMGGFFTEAFMRAIGKEKPPTLTRYAVSLLGRSTSYSIARARRELGWEPRIHPLDGLRQVVAWYRHHNDPTSGRVAIPSV